MANHTQDNPFWHDVLSGRIRKRVWRRRLFRLISPGAREQCHLRLAPFDGVTAPLMRAIGTERGTHEFAALGKTMNLGARLVTAAGAGEIVISGAIWPSVAGEIRAERRAFNLKGIDGPVVAHVARVERQR